MKNWNFVICFVLVIIGVLFSFLFNDTDEFVAYTYDAIGNKFGDLSTGEVYRDGEYINLDRYKPVKAGYVFKGWTKTGNCNEIIHYDIISAGVTYKACYVKTGSNSGKTNTKSVFVLQGGVLKSSDANIGSTVDLNKVVVTRSGYRFLGWYTASSGGSKVTGVRKLDSVIYAHWAPYQLTIYYNGNGGIWCGKSGSGYSINTKGNVLYNRSTYSLIRNYGVVVSEKYGLANYDNNVAVCFKKQGYLALSGGEWNTKSNGMGTSFDHNNTKLTTLDVARGAGCDLTIRNCEVTLYVNWKSTSVNSNGKFTVSFNANGGTVSNKKINTIEVKKNSSVNLNNYVPVRTGYVFNGWYLNSASGSKVTGNQKISTNINYYAHWTAKTISVNFYRNASSSDTTKVTQKFTYGKNGQKFGSTGFGKSGYTLTGWSLSKGGAQNYSVSNGVGNAWINMNYPSINVYAVWRKSEDVSSFRIVEPTVAIGDYKQTINKHDIKIVDTTGKQLPNSNFNFKSDNAGIASVSSTGTITANFGGTTSVTVSLKNNPNISKKIKVYVVHTMYSKVKIIKNGGVTVTDINTGKKVTLKKGTTGEYNGLGLVADERATGTLGFQKGDTIKINNNYYRLPANESILKPDAYNIKKEFSKEAVETFVNSYSFKSETNYLFWVNQGTQYTYMFEKVNGKWKFYKSWPVSTGDALDLNHGTHLCINHHKKHPDYCRGTPIRLNSVKLGNKVQSNGAYSSSWYRYSSAGNVAGVIRRRSDTGKSLGNAWHIHYEEAGRNPSSNGCTRVPIKTLKWIMKNLNKFGNSRIIDY